MTRLLFRADPYLRSCTAALVRADGPDLTLDRTVFYAAGGGQPGDQGELRTGGQTFRVNDTRKGPDDTVIHQLDRASADLAPGAPVALELDWARRHRLMRMHTALHLLCAAIARPVTGGQIGDGKGRLDFDLGEGSLDKDAILARVQAWIADDRPVTEQWIEAEELAARPELVRTMAVRPPATSGRIRLVAIDGVDLQACGGTHVRSTAEIGGLVIGKVENKGRQNRRVNLAFA